MLASQNGNSYNDDNQTKEYFYEIHESQICLFINALVLIRVVHYLGPG